MRRRLKIQHLILAVILSGAVIVSCTEEGENANNNGDNIDQPASLQVALVDDPADYDAVLVEVIGFDYKLDPMSDTEVEDEDDDSENEDDNRLVDDGDGEWMSATITPTVYNLLELNNGTEALLADLDLPAGEIEQVRVILGENNSVVIDGDTMALTTPSAQQSGLKLKIDEEIESGGNYKLILDFDAAKSVVEAGKSGKYILKPVIYATLVDLEAEVELGSIAGFVHPAPDSISSIVYLIKGDDSVSTYPEMDGRFIFENLESDTFNISAVPHDSTGLDAVTMEDIILAEGEDLELDTLKF